MFHINIGSTFIRIFFDELFLENPRIGATRYNFTGVKSIIDIIESIINLKIVTYLPPRLKD